MKNLLPTHLKSLGTTGGLISKLPIKPSPLALTESYKILVEAHNDYKKTVEVETTKRHAIAAWKENRLTDLENRRAILESYLIQNFSERRFMIEEMFQRLDQGIAAGNDQLIGGALGAIVSIASQSPLSNVDKLIGDINNDDIDFIEI